MGNLKKDLLNMYVTWDQLIQVGIFLTGLIGLIVMIFKNK